MGHIDEASKEEIKNTIEEEKRQDQVEIPSKERLKITHEKEENKNTSPAQEVNI